MKISKIVPSYKYAKDFMTEEEREVFKCEVKRIVNLIRDLPLSKNELKTN